VRGKNPTDFGTTKGSRFPSAGAKFKLGASAAVPAARLSSYCCRQTNRRTQRVQNHNHMDQLRERSLYQHTHKNNQHSMGNLVQLVVLG